MHLGISIFGLGANRPKFSPWSSSRCVLWYDAAMTQVYASTLVAAGTTPPAATLSGLQTIFLPVDLFVKCTTSGTTGSGATALGSFYIDGGTTPIATGVALSNSINLGALNAALAGLTLSFATGNTVSTSTQNTWQGGIASQNSLKTPTDVLSAINSSTPRLLTGANGILGGPAWQGDGLKNALQNTSAPALNTTTGCFFWGVMAVSAQNPPVTSPQHTLLCGGNQLTPLVSCDNPATFGINYNWGSVHELTPGVTIGTAKRMILNGTAGSQFVQWGSAVHTQEVGNNNTSRGLTILARNDLAASFFLNGKWACGGWFTGQPTAQSLATALDSWASNSGRFPSGAASLFT